jgi:hypothetical protein
MASAALPETLRSVTSTKIQELKKKRAQYEAFKTAILQQANTCTEERERTTVLLHGICHQARIPVTEEDSSDTDDDQTSDSYRQRRNQQLFLRQAGKDPAFAPSLVQGIQEELRQSLDRESVQHEHAQFFCEVVTEWISASQEQKSPQAMAHVMDESSFENVGRKEMHEQRAQWESIVFSKSEVAEADVKEYLNRLFKTKDVVAKAFQEIENDTRSYGASLRNTSGFFDCSYLKATINGVLQTDLLSEEKVAILRTFRNNRDILQEVADVLNMRLTALENWEWTTASGAVPVQQRRQLNGKYRVFMDDDVLDALLLHAIGMKWAVHFKSCLTTFFKSSAWKTPGRSIPNIDRVRRAYFLGGESPLRTVDYERLEHYAKDYFMAQLPSTEDEGPRDYGDEADSDVEHADKKSPLEAKQQLLRLAITEASVARHLRPGVAHAVIRSDFEWFGPSLPHETIFAVLQFFGMPQTWLDFFRQFLQAPTRFVQDGPEGQIQVRQRGVPMSHVLSDVFGELILFVMDFAVNQATQTYLYRLHDDFWFWGTPDVCLRGWQAMADFCTATGIKFNLEKTGSVVFTPVAAQNTSDSSDHDEDFSTGDDDPKPTPAPPRLPKGEVRWGFLRLDPVSVRFVIDKEMVDKHITELRRQLSCCTSMFSWVRAYNAYLARFFSNNLGQPSYAFGREHIDDMIDTFARIQQAIFPDGSVIEHLSKVADERWGMTGIPAGVWYWPVQMGGLELRDPLIPLFCMRKTMHESRQKILSDALELDESRFFKQKRAFKMPSLRHHIPSAISESLDDEFMPKEEYLRYREERSDNLGAAYRRLLTVPAELHIQETKEMTWWLNKLPSADQDPRLSSCGIVGPFKSMQPYWKWTLAMYGAQIVKRYGSLQMIEPAQVPLGVISAMREGRVRWQG